MNKIYYIAAFILSTMIGSDAFAQTYTMTNGQVSACSGTFYDPGGTGTYGNSQSFTYTICPSTPGAKVVINFTAFSTEYNFDFLTIYNGPNTASPTLGTYTGTAGPGIVSATPTNASGCLTFVFTSDGSVVGTGWTGTISCSTPCPTITSGIASTTPAAVGGIIRRCPNQSTTFTATAGSGGTGPYTYTWSMGNGTTLTGQTINYAYPTSGSYQVSLVVRDVNNCPTTLSYTVIVQVATTPTITTSATPNPICLGQSSNLAATVAMTPFVPNCTPPVAGTTFLPDGSGVSYTTAITVNCFAPGQTVTAASNFSNICLNLEHSYLGDLNIVLICPNGQSMILKSYGQGGNGTYLGNALDDGTTNPGTGFTYCFTPTATTFLVNGPTVLAGNPLGNSIAAGNYMPLNPFSNLIGCPLNGAWTIQVTDNLAIDNGYIFNWDVNFTVPAATGAFTPTIASQGWSAATGLTSTGTTTATVTPTAVGSPCYTYSVTDNFGCTFTQNQCITVTANTPVNAGPDVTICNAGSTALTATGATTYSWSPAIGLSATTGASVTANPTVTTTYTVTGTTGTCISTDQVVVNVALSPAVNAGPDKTFCIGGSTTLTATGATTYSWSPATGLSATTGASVTANPTVNTTYTVTGTTAGCTATDQVLVTVNPLPTINGGVDQTVCAGQTVTLTATGGATYTWAPAVTNGTAFTPAATGTYTVTGTSAAGCINTDQVLVTVNPLPVVVVADVTICATATATLTATGAATYSWSPATNLSAATGATVTFTPGTTTTYTITGTSLGCTSTDQATVTVLPNAPINAGADAAICTGASTTLTATGGATYTWSPATGLSATTGASVTANPTTTTTYSVTGTDASGCVGTDQVIVTVNPLPTINGGVDQTVCAGQTVTLTATGGATYTWAPVVTNGTAFTPVATGTYTVTGTDANGCINTDQVLVTVNPLPTIVVADVTICATATATLTATGAATYSWTPATNLDVAAGPSVVFTPGTTTTYTISGTDANGCVSTDQATVNVLANAPINAGADVAICSGASTPLTGTGGVTYTWSPATGLSATTGASVTANPTATATYSVTGTDASGCVGTDQVIVTVNPLPTINGGVDQTVCAGQTVTLTATGGATYTWAPVVTNGTAFTPVATGTYTVTGTDANGCINTDQVLVTVNPLPTIVVADVTICATATATLTATGAATYSWTPATNLDVTAGPSVVFTPGTTTTYTISGTDANGCVSTDQATVNVLTNAPINAGADVAICTGASTTLTATGGATYTWSPATGLSATTGASVIANPTATTTYTVSGTDANGCVGSDQVIVTVNPLPIIDGGADQTVCAGQTVTLTATGGATYTWAPVVTNGTAFTPVATGTYTVTGTDANGCINTDQVLVTVNPLPTIAVADVTICATATATLTATGAATYSWSPATNLDVAAGPSVVFTPGTTTTYTISGTDANGCVSTDQATVNVLTNAPINAGADVAICSGASTPLTGTGGVTYTWSPATGLSATTGASVTANPTTTTTYSVTGTDASGCVGTDQVIVTVNPLPTINGGVDQTVCAGQTVTLTATGGATYTWAPVVTNGSAFTPAIGSTTYTVTGTSAGCASTDQVVVNVNPLPTIGAGVDVAICINGSTTLTATGGSTYTWSPATGLSATTGIIVTANPTATSSYTVTGTDANGCISTDQVIVSVNPLPTVNAGLDVVVCAGQTVTLNGTGAITYSWTAPVVNGLAFAPAATTTYTVTGTSALGCVNTDQVLVTVNPLPTVIGGPDQTVCIGAQVTLIGQGATTYSWSPLVTNGTAFTPVLGATTYTVTGTTAAGCASTDQVVVTATALPTINAGADVSVCDGSQVSLTATGGTSYTWAPAITNGNPFVPTIGSTTYSVTGTDANGCIASDQVIVLVNQLPTVIAGNDIVICAGVPITLTGSGAATYTWSPVITNNVPFVPAAGTTVYTVTGTTAAGCTGTDQLSVSVNSNLLADFTPVTTVGCTPLTVTFTNNTLNSVNCVWTMGDGTTLSGCSTVTNTYELPGCYDVTLTVTAQNGCVSNLTIFDAVCVEAIPDAEFAPSTNTINEYNMEVSFNNNSTGASNYVWDFGDGSPSSTDIDPIHDYTNSPYGNYEVMLVAISPAGCSDTAYSVIQIIEELIYYVPNTFTPDGDTYNQTFKPVFTSGFDIYDYALYIYDRWGEVIFESHDANYGWDGAYGTDKKHDVQDGTYTWVIEFKVSMNDEHKRVNGHVNVIR